MEWFVGRCSICVWKLDLEYVFESDDVFSRIELRLHRRNAQEHGKYRIHQRRKQLLPYSTWRLGWQVGQAQWRGHETCLRWFQGIFDETVKYGFQSIWWSSRKGIQRVLSLAHKTHPHQVHRVQAMMAWHCRRMKIYHHLPFFRLRHDLVVIYNLRISIPHICPSLHKWTCFLAKQSQKRRPKIPLWSSGRPCRCWRSDRPISRPRQRMNIKSQSSMPQRIVEVRQRIL